MDLFSQAASDVQYYRHEKLTVARRAKMLSLEELASSIGKSRQFVHKLEKGTEPTNEVVEMLCKALDITPAFLFTERKSHIDTEKCHFRSLKTRTKTVTLNVKSRVEILSSVLQQLDKEFELPEVDIPDVSDFDISKNSEIERLSEAVRNYWDLGMGPISNVMELLEHIGIVVSNSKGTDGKVDAFSVSNSRPLIILDNDLASACRNRFTLAHELGHLLFHEDIITGDSSTESQADYFASSFLLPRTSFVSEFPCRGDGRFDWDKMVQFKSRWKVSLKAIVYRAKQLGLISEQKARTAYMHLNTRGYAIRELGDESVKDEQAYLLPNMINMLEVSTWREILSSIGVSEPLIFEVFGLKHERSTLHKKRYLTVVK
ncbi:helix-turn-helix domain-containing protein [Vibrio vulnificus]|uniref:helix-turn-helix domain-containing protein n=1 Tax=Vibrio vulnificus TaxID=672 RepID=UPI00215D0596|nr:XRE family transcriptional regulator [Vibrio vulnificus]MCR9500903.1 XRE family transcriptional regulator [Vibrio vulnificus]MCU8412437.1 XRE family transcriptional regulator [Vibrio vulnificus]